MKKYLYVAIAMLILPLAGCGDNASDITSAPAASIEETEKPELIETMKFMSSEVDVESQKNKFSEILDEYVKVIENDDDEGLMNLLLADNEYAAVTEELLKTQLGKEISEKEILDFYKVFYQKELHSLCNSFPISYGEYKIEYEIKNTEFSEQQEILDANRVLKEFGIDNLIIQDAVTLDVQFYVIDGVNRIEVSQSFLSPSITLLKIKDQWNLGISENFPRPSSEELKAFYGLEQTDASEEIMQGYTDEQLCNMAKIYYMNQHEYAPSYVTVDHVSGDIVTIHLYDVTNVMLDDGSTVGFTSTHDWYDINRYTAEGTNFMGEDINLAQ